MNNENIFSSKTVRRAIFSIGIVNFVAYIYSMSSTMITYIMESYPDLPQTTVNQILTLPGIVGLIASFLIGPIMMKVSKKFLLTLNAIFMIGYGAIFVLVGGNGPFWLFYVAAVLAGISMGTQLSICTVVISEFTEPKKRPAFAAVCTASMNAGAALLNVVGGYIAQGNGGANWPYAYIPPMVLSIICTILWIVLMPDLDKMKKNVQTDVASVEEAAAEVKAADGEKGGSLPVGVILLAVMYALFYIGVYSYLLNVSNYIIVEHKLGTSAQAGIANSIFTAMSIVIGISYAFWQKAFKKWLPIVGFGLLIVGLMLMNVVTTSIFVVYIAVVLMGWAFSLINNYLVAYGTIIAPPKLAPIAASLIVGGMNIGIFVAAYILAPMGNLLGGGISGQMNAGIVFMVVNIIIGLYLFVYKAKKDNVNM